MRRMEVRKNKKIIERVSEIYNWIEAQQLANKGIAGSCAACGKCCDFEQYDHRLYVTTPEMLFFVDKLRDKNITGRFITVIPAEAGIQKAVCNQISSIKMPRGRCPYQVNDKCTVYPYRFSGCRIFCCKGDAGFQSELTESAIKKFKALCDELQIPYRYVELPAALKEILPTERKNTEEGGQKDGS